jgi:hypothetical protein
VDVFENVHFFRPYRPDSNEQVVEDAASSPPLRSGRWYIGVQARTRGAGLL